MTATTKILAASAFVLSSTIASADLMWDEAIDGDLSNDYLNPTQLFVKGVNNHVRFTTDSISEVDREYFTGRRQGSARPSPSSSGAPESCFRYHTTRNPNLRFRNKTKTE